MQDDLPNGHYEDHSPIDLPSKKDPDKRQDRSQYNKFADPSRSPQVLIEILKHNKVGCYCDQYCDDDLMG